jgi:hypothetical protein
MGGHSSVSQEGELIVAKHLVITEIFRTNFLEGK